jgi:hypothetical protein
VIVIVISVGELNTDAGRVGFGDRILQRTDNTCESIYPFTPYAIAFTVAFFDTLNAPEYTIPVVAEGVLPSVVYLMLPPPGLESVTLIALLNICPSAIAAPDVVAVGIDNCPVAAVVKLNDPPDTAFPAKSVTPSVFTVHILFAGSDCMRVKVAELFASEYEPSCMFTGLPSAVRMIFESVV